MGLDKERRRLCQTALDQDSIALFESASCLWYAGGSVSEVAHVVA